MRRLYKYALAMGPGCYAVQAPADARFLHIGLQGNTAVVWAAVTINAPSVFHQFEVIGTGDPVPMAQVWKEAVYIGSYEVGSHPDDGSSKPYYIWHVYYKGYSR